MPNTDGCLHAHADDVAGIWDDLVNKLNVTVHDNPFTTVDYPYEPQGIISVYYLRDGDGK